MKHVIEVARGKGSLNAQVWQHEAEATRQGLRLVVELTARRHPVSKAIDSLWRKRDQFVADTLEGIYLLRVELPKFGPKAVIELTPYAIFGVPLFIAWNKLGQILAANAFRSTEPTELASVLSSYFEDVAHDRKHELHPSPRLPVAKPRPSPAATPPPGDGPAGAPMMQPPAAAAEPPAPDARQADPKDPVAALEADLPRFLANAEVLARRFLRQHECRDDHSLHSLRQLDAYLDEHEDAIRTPEFVAQHLAALGVYLGAVVVANGNAEWFVDRAQTSPIDALTLRVVTPDGTALFRPVAVALDRLHDAKRGFYGHAVGMCRTL